MSLSRQILIVRYFIRNNMKRVLITCYPSDLSGVPIYVNQVVKALSSSYRFRIVTKSAGVAFTQYHDYPNVEVSERPELINSISPIAAKAFYQSVQMEINQFRPDILHLNGTLFSLFGRLASRGSKAQVIVTHHGLPWGPGISQFQSMLALSLEKLAQRARSSTNILISKNNLNR